MTPFYHCEGKGSGLISAGFRFPKLELPAGKLVTSRKQQKLKSFCSAFLHHGFVLHGSKETELSTCNS